MPCWAGWNIGFVLYSNYVPPVPGACCRPDGSCVMVPQEQCVPPDVWFDGPCDPNPCPPVPVENKSWGQIKNQYR